MQYGMVFGIEPLAAFLFSPLLGTLGLKIGPVHLQNLGYFAIAVCGITFGPLIYINNAMLFLCLSYFIRFVQGIANAAAWMSNLSILIYLFPNYVCRIISWTKLITGIGYTSGFMIGSVLYSFG